MATETLTPLVDGDPIAYLAAAYAIKADDARHAGQDAAARLLRKFGVRRAYFARSDPSRRYWRHDLFPDYKSASGKKPRPQHLLDAWAGIEACPGVVIKQLPSCEADDVMGILATHESLRGRCLVVGTDKDLLTIPGVHWRKDARREVCPIEAGFYHLVQTLVGDSSDGYPGCPGVGIKRAGSVIGLDAYARSPASAWAGVVAAYKAAGKTEDDALLQARVARICRVTEYDLVAKRVVLWTPPDEHATFATPAAPDATPASLFPDAAPAAGWPR